MKTLNFLDRIRTKIEEILLQKKTRLQAPTTIWLPRYIHTLKNSFKTLNTGSRILNLRLF